LPKAAFTTLGCKVNQFETEVMEGLFKARGYELVAFDEVADVYVLNTCSVTHLGEKKSRQLIRRANRLNPSAVVAVTGCYAQVAPDQLKAIEGVRVIVGTKERGRIVDLVEQAKNESGIIDALTNIMQADEFEDIPLFDAPPRTRAFLKIQEGCSNFCTYCIIPYARGPLRSRRLDSVLNEAQKLVAAGFKEIVLTGIHLGAYGRDLEGQPTLADAAAAILKLKDLKRLRLGSLESIELSKELFAVMRGDKRFCPHLHLPLQSGSDITLAAMNRHYTKEEFAALLKNVRQEIPDIALSTDIIVGFPNESEENFKESLEFAAAQDFARIHVFPYSKRKGTPAAEFKNQVDEAVKKERVHRMQKMAEEKAKLYRARFIGEKLPVLFETDTDGIYDGLTVNYIRVYVKSDKDLRDEIYDVRLTGQYKDGLFGEIVK
jgi:threonylcarbamoyladenosine tRNA methylthiotransferase MtaB